MKTNAVSWIGRLRRSADEEDIERNENRMKVKRNTKRVMWLIGRGLATSKVKELCGEEVRKGK